MINRCFPSPNCEVHYFVDILLTCRKYSLLLATLIFFYFCAAKKALGYMLKYVLPHGLQLAGAVSGKDSHVSSKIRYIYICGRRKKENRLRI